MSRGDRSRPERERSPEERERDREERARRRALAAKSAPGEPLATPPPADDPVATPPPADFESPPAEPVARAPLDPPPVAFEPAVEEPVAAPPVEFDPAAEEPVAAPPVEFDPAPHDPAPGSSVEREPVPPEPIAPHTAEFEPALAEDQLAPSEPFPPAPPPPAAAPRRPAAAFAAGAPARRRRRHSSPGARFVALIALLGAIAAVVLIARALIRSGHTTPPAPAPKVVKLLIPEGKTRAQIAQIAKAGGLTGSYRVASRRSPLLDPTRYGAPHSTPDLEGFLFPATYDVNPGQPASRLVQEQLVAFRENFGTATIAAAHALHVTPYGLLTVASMIEREAQVPGDRAKIAAVIYNRLKQGMPLGIDAAIYYAVEEKRGIATYTSELTEADLHIDSPYNTRTHTGLPPTPISNPGLASIEAAAHPAHVSYLYYVAAADGCGEQVFSATQAAFEANAAAYAAAVSKNGGRPPTCKHK